MSDDIFHSWKENRFIIAPQELVDKEQLVVLTDFNYWTIHADELLEWCNERNVVTQGMTVVFPDEASLLEFVLRWS